MTVHLELLRPEHDSLLRQLYQLYVYDFSEFMGWDVGEGGRFADDDLDGCWTDPSRRQYLIRSAGRPAGFVLIDQRERSFVTQQAPIIEVREFFVLRAYRRRGVGSAAAAQAFDLFRGRWEVCELRENVAAQAFWRRVIGRYTGGLYQEADWSGSGLSGVMQTFDNRVF
jgi:predicted acetyltransferase